MGELKVGSELLIEYKLLNQYEELFNDGEIVKNKELVEHVLRDGRDLFVEGNDVLKNTNTSRFLIFDLPRKITCIYSTELCRDKCFQIGVEELYSSEKKDSTVKYRRKKNLIKSLDKTFVKVASTEVIKQLNNCLSCDFIVRIHGDGDFYSVDYLLKWIEIAFIVEKNKRKQISFFKSKDEDSNSVIFVAYTKSLKYIVDIFIKDEYLTKFKMLIKEYKGVDTLEELTVMIGSCDNISVKISELVKKFIPINFLASIMDEENDDNNELNKMLNQDLKLFTYTAQVGDVIQDEYFCDIKNIKCGEGKCLKCYPPTMDIITKLR